MAVDENRRHEVYEAFKASHGPDIAGALMEMLPPVGVPELATKHDLALLRSDVAALEERIALRFNALDERFKTLEARLGERLERELKRQTTRFVALMFGGFAAFGGAAGAVGAVF